MSCDNADFDIKDERAKYHRLKFDLLLSNLMRSPMQIFPQSRFLFPI